MKMCELCGNNPATVPDRNRQGRPVKRICGVCHAVRLRQDVEHVLELRAARQAKTENELEWGKNWND